MPAESARPRPAARSRRNLPFEVDKDAIKRLHLVAVAFSHIEREWFPTEEAYQAELEVETRAQEVLQALQELKINAACYPADRYFLAKLIVDKPDLVLNLVDTVRGRDALQTSVPAALELAEIPYTGAGMRGMVIGNDRNLFKELLEANDVPTPEFQLIGRRGAKVNPELGFPLIVKLNESGGSVGIDNAAVKETPEEVRQKIDEMIGTYHIPVVVERFIDGPEITAVVFDDGQRAHVFLGQKKFRRKPDGKHEFTSLESYSDARSYTYQKPDAELAKRIEPLVIKAFNVLHNRDYAKFDIRVDQDSGTLFFTDCNPNTAFGPHLGLPFTEVLALYNVPFEHALASLVSKHAKKIAKAAG